MAGEMKMTVPVQAISGGESDKYRALAEKISRTMRGNVSNSIQNFAHGGKDFTDQGR